MTFARTQFQVVTHYDPSKTYNGYTLFTPMGAEHVWLVDMEGHFVHRWEMPYRPAAYGVLLPNGNLLYAGKVMSGPLIEFGGFGGVLLEADWDGNIVWKYEDLYQHHDFYRMNNGNTMVLRWVSVPQDIAVRVKGGLSGTECQGMMWTDSFREVTPAGEVVWEWLAYEHLDPVVDVVCPLCPRSEWTHANACFVLPNGDILTVFRRTDTIALIDKGTSDIKWRWGTGELAHPHDPTMLYNGNVLVFDNGYHRKLAPPNYSRVVEVNPKTNRIKWEYQDDPPSHFYGSLVSSCERLPNGNTLICEGTTGRIFEVTMDKEVVWEFVSPFYHDLPGFGQTNLIFRAYRYGPDHPGLQGKTLNPDKFEWALREKAKPKEKVELEEAMRERLERMGY